VGNEKWRKWRIAHSVLGLTGTVGVCNVACGILG